MIEIQNLHKTYEGGFKALDDISLQIQKGEIFALLGPNGAGKTTLISIVCGISNQTSGSVRIDGFDTVKDFRDSRSLVGLVPQELTADAFETVWNTVSFSRGLFGKKKDDQHLEKTLRMLSLWDKKDNKLMELSGGMKRRVLIAKALSHEPEVLFLDEPTAGVDVELRKDMWKNIEQLRESGVTVILTTHYLEEAEEMADRIGVIQNGRLILVEEKEKLMKTAGKKTLDLEFERNIEKLEIELPLGFKAEHFEKNDRILSWNFDPEKQGKELKALLQWMAEPPVPIVDFRTRQSSLEEIFVQLTGGG